MSNFQCRGMSKLGDQPKVCGEKRVHVRIHNLLADGHPIQENPFVMRPRFFRDAFAGVVPNRDHDLGTDDMFFLKCEAPNKFRGADGKSAAAV